MRPDRGPVGNGSRRQAGVPQGPLAHGRGSRIAGEFVRVIEQFDVEYGRIFAGDEKWQSMPAPTGTLFEWDSASTYVREPPYFLEVARVPAPPSDVIGARALALLGDSITTDHISPAGTITANSPAGKFLVEHAVPPAEFNSFGSRRGNHEVMMRGTFGNIRLHNLMTPGVEGPWTIHVPSGEKMSIYDASLRYQHEGTPLVVIAGKEYGSGSSRDWAAKGSALLGIKAVIAQTYERIHRSNLVCMGVLPLQFEAGVSAQSLGLTGFETFSITGIGAGITPRQTAKVTVTRQDGSQSNSQRRCGSMRPPRSSTSSTAASCRWFCANFCRPEHSTSETLRLVEPLLSGVRHRCIPAPLISVFPI